MIANRIFGTNADLAMSVYYSMPGYGGTFFQGMQGVTNDSRIPYSSVQSYGSISRNISSRYSSNKPQYLCEGFVVTSVIGNDGVHCLIRGRG